MPDKKGIDVRVVYIICLVSLAILTYLITLTILSGPDNAIYDTFDPRLFHNYSQYHISIQSDSPIENATFVIPLPMKNGTPQVGGGILNESDFIADNVSVEFTNDRPNLNLTGAETPDGYELCFVTIHASRLVLPASGPYVTVYRMERNVNTPMGEYSGFINTLHPVGNESLIVPKFNFTFRERELDRIDGKYVRYKSQQIPQKTLIYIDYVTSPSARVHISFGQRSNNEWKEGYDAWAGNSYSEYFTKGFTGSQNGWFFIDGYLGQSEGVYPNPDNPDWQAILKQSSGL